MLRARQLLHKRLTRRGVCLPLGVLATLLAAGGEDAAAPPALVPASAEALAEQAIRATACVKAKVVLALLLTVCAVAAGVGALMPPKSSGRPNGEAPKAEQPQAQAEPADLRTDRYGDPLPLGALARLGTVRWRHGGQVMAVAFSPDGTTLASGSMDEAIHLWDARTGRLRRILRGHEDAVNAVFFTPDGKQLVSCGWDHTAHVWDVPTGKELRRWPITGGWKLALSPDGKLLAGLGAPRPNQNTIALWDIGTGKQVRELPFEGERDFVNDLAFSPDGKQLVSGGGSILRLFDVVKGKQLRTFGEGKRINSVAFSSDGMTVAVARHQEAITLWNVSTAKKLRQFDFKEGVRVAFSHDGKTLAGCNSAFTKIILWDVATGQKLRELPDQHYQVWGLAFSPDDKTLAVGNLDSQVRLWDVSTGKELSSVGGHRGRVNVLAFTDRDRGIASVSDEGTVCHWDITTSKMTRKFHEEGTHCFCGDLSPNGRTLALGDDAGVHLFEWSAGKKLRLLKGHKRQVWAAVFSPKGDVLASSANMDQHILLWDVAAGKELRRILTPYLHNLRSLAWSPNGKMLASAGARAVDNSPGLIDTVCLWEPSTGRRLREWALRQSKEGLQSGGVFALAFSPDGTLLAAADGDNTIVVWDAATGNMRARLIGHRKKIGALAFAPDGLMLASGGMDRTIRLWELSTWKERRRYEGHLGRITKLAFSADGLTLASAGSDTSVLLWSVMDRDPRQRQPDLALGPRQLKDLWDDLAGEDASRAWRAVCALVQAPKQSVPWLKEHLKPLSAADFDRIMHLIADLDSDQFAARQQAARELEKLGERAQPAMRKALERHPSLEARRRLEQLLEKLEGPVRAAGAMRELRALEVLEHVGTAEAQNVLKTLANGAPEARLTREAEASLQRLSRRGASQPR